MLLKTIQKSRNTQFGKRTGKYPQYLKKQTKIIMLKKIICQSVSKSFFPEMSIQHI